MSESSNIEISTPISSQQSFISDFLRAPEEVMCTIYRNNRQVFLAWGKANTRFSEEELADLFQESVVNFCQNIQNKKLTSLNCSVRTYLFGIAKKLMCRRWRAYQRITFPGEEHFHFPAELNASVEQSFIEEEELEFLHSQINKLSENCRKVLHYTFYDNLKSSQIAELMGYASEEVVRVQRKRCLERLRNYLKK